MYFQLSIMFLVTKSRSTRAWPVVVGHNSFEIRCTKHPAPYKFNTRNLCQRHLSYRYLSKCYACDFGSHSICIILC